MAQLTRLLMGLVVAVATLIALVLLLGLLGAATVGAVEVVILTAVALGVAAVWRLGPRRRAARNRRAQAGQPGEADAGRSQRRGGPSSAP